MKFMKVNYICAVAHGSYYKSPEWIEQNGRKEC